LGASARPIVLSLASMNTWVVSARAASLSTGQWDNYGALECLCQADSLVVGFEEHARRYANRY
jgi:hypothetical protein